MLTVSMDTQDTPWIHPCAHITKINNGKSLKQQYNLKEQEYTSSNINQHKKNVLIKTRNFCKGSIQK